MVGDQRQRRDGLGSTLNRPPDAEEPSVFSFVAKPGDMREHKLGVMRHSRLRLRERLKPFLPFLDRPQLPEAQDMPYKPDESWINLEVVRGWLAACKRQHGHRCQLVNHNPCSPTRRPAWLIDVQNLCLVSGAPDMPYFALSYVWGTAISARTELANLALLQQPGALEDAVEMPKTVAHAVKLTKLLGERYLWTDRFCIVQNNNLETQAQLDGMGDIYAGALATIVAATEGDADAGLKGIPGVTPRRYFSMLRRQDNSDLPLESWMTVARSKGSYSSDAAASFISRASSGGEDKAPPARARPDEEVANWLSHEIDDEEGGSFAQRQDYTASDAFDCNSIIESEADETSLFAASEYASEDDLGDVAASSTDAKAKANTDILVEQARLLMNSTWYSRGWTFQEQMFSGRKIIFQGETVNWECCCAAWHEAQGSPIGVDHRPLAEQREEETVTETLKTNDTPWPDLYRFARLISLYNRRQLTYPEDVIDAFAGVISGLNHSFVGGFISGLPRMFFDSAMLWQPHRPMSRRVKMGEQGACLPSWSWVGWHGTLNSESWRSGYDYLRKNADEYVESDSSIWQPASWHTTSTISWFYIDDACNRHVINVCGHQGRDTLSDTTQALPEGWTRHNCEESGKTFFRHACDPVQEFWYPLPLRKETDPLSVHVRAKQLWCKTRRAVLEVGDMFRSNAAGQCLCVDLVDGEKNWVGVLRYASGFAPWNELEVTHNNKHELIELSAGSVLNQETEAVSFDEWLRPGCPRHTGKYEFYNVMAVRWNGPTASRLAVGRVEKTAWERLALKEIEVTLG